MEEKPNILNNLLYIFPVMLYYLLEAFVVSAFILLIWTLTLSKTLGYINYFHIVGAYWIFKMLMFDVFKLIAGINQANNNIVVVNNENNGDNNQEDHD